MFLPLKVCVIDCSTNTCLYQSQANNLLEFQEDVHLIDNFKGEVSH